MPKSSSNLGVYFHSTSIDEPSCPVPKARTSPHANNTLTMATLLGTTFANCISWKSLNASLDDCPILGQAVMDSESQKMISLPQVHRKSHTHESSYSKEPSLSQIFYQTVLALALLSNHKLTQHKITTNYIWTVNFIKNSFEISMQSNLAYISTRMSIRTKPKFQHLGMNSSTI